MNAPASGKTPTERLLEAGLQKYDLKLGLDVPAEIGQDGICDRLLAVFGRWRDDTGEEVIDLQDYSHVTNGPGVVLVSKRWVLSVDWADAQPGVLLSTRRKLSGANSEERLIAAARLLLEKTIRLLGEPELRDAARANASELSIAINDRVLSPKSEENDAAIRPAVAALLDRLYGDAAREVTARGASTRLEYHVRVDGQERRTADDLLTALDA